MVFLLFLHTGAYWYTCYKLFQTFRKQFYQIQNLCPQEPETDQSTQLRLQHNIGTLAPGVSFTNWRIVAEELKKHNDACPAQFIRLEV